MYTYHRHEGIFLRLLQHSKGLLNAFVEFRKRLLVVLHGRFLGAADTVENALGAVAAGLDLEGQGLRAYRKSGNQQVFWGRDGLGLGFTSISSANFPSSNLLLSTLLVSHHCSPFLRTARSCSSSRTKSGTLKS